MTETQQRFLKAIAERIPADHVAEVRLFPAIRQGHVESGVAVVAVEALAADTGEREVPLVATPGDVGERSEDFEPLTSAIPSHVTPRTSPLRFSILTAHYRLTFKGPDRGKWEFELVHDADAPLETVEHVVRGVVRRVGDDGDPDLMSRTDFHRAITEPWWSAPA